MTALEPARTFWDQAIIPDAEHLRPAEPATLDRHARHHADMERLLRHPDGAAMLAVEETEARQMIL